VNLHELKILIFWIVVPCYVEVEWIMIGKNHTVCEDTVIYQIYGDAICMYHNTQIIQILILIPPF
jgi:hypothetical protein